MPTKTKAQAKKPSSKPITAKTTKTAAKAKSKVTKTKITKNSDAKDYLASLEDKATAKGGDGCIFC